MANLKLIFKEQTEEYTVDPNESDVYRIIGQKLQELSKCMPGSLRAELDGYGFAVFLMKERGSYIKDGVEYPSMYVTEDCNTISGLAPSEYEDAYLTCINPESNNYKFYHLKPSQAGIDATYGRIGSQRGETFGTRNLSVPYKTRMYWIRYYEKLSKGYVDQTDIYLPKQTVEKKRTKKRTPEGPSAELYAMLMRYARHVVNESLTNSNITRKQVKEARKIYNELCKKVQLKAFNRWLMKLLVLSPRKIDVARHMTVQAFLAESPDDFERIILREENLLLAMEAVAGEEVEMPEESFKSFGIDVFEATSEQKKKVVAKLSPQLQPLVKKVYRVIPKKQKEKFDKYLKDNHISHVKELWHGSKNENWLSIIVNSLQLNPNAQITGKMFGEGIYFAPSSMKSWGYTSYYGTHWAGGNQGKAFMGVYAVAYGKPYYVNSHGAYHVDQKYLKSIGCNCLHAEPARTGLRNDEIVFYDEASVCLNYIVEFE